MKSLFIPIIVLLACGQSLASENSPKPLFTVNQQAISITDSVKKTISAKDLKALEKQIKKSMPKEMAKVMIAQLKNLDPEKLKTLDVNQLQFDAGKMDEAAEEMDYKIERQEIIDEFKNDTYDNGADRREARRQMKEDLKELRKDFKEEQKERKKERKEEQKEARLAKKEMA